MKAVVVEDSRLAREGLINLLQRFPELDVVGSANHPSSALPLIHSHKPDVIFLDIHMPGASGFDLLAQLHYMPKIIFTTAYSDYAVRSFDYLTIDYLLKPISEERLAKAIDKLLLSASEPLLAKASLDITSKMLVKNGDDCHLIPLDSIFYFESCKNYSRLFFENKNAFIKKSLSALEERLPRQHFFRINRQYIVNINAIDHIEEGIGEGYEILMRNQQRLSVSRRNAQDFRELLSF